ncbi:MAG: hypothetical protein HC767_11480 [Akkermansiaceae bacterium]|nr:hypothetical protein [Akkermansiaceae bacterium]
MRYTRLRMIALRQVVALILRYLQTWEVSGEQALRQRNKENWRSFPGGPRYSPDWSLQEPQRYAAPENSPPSGPDQLCPRLVAIQPELRGAPENAPAARFRDQVQPILDAYCYACHGNGATEGGRALDAFVSDEAMLANRKLWWAVLKNVRSGIMPPASEERPNDDERRRLTDWIKFNVFGIDPDNLDPGRVTLRRLNRVEYQTRFAT